MGGCRFFKLPSTFKKNIFLSLSKLLSFEGGEGNGGERRTQYNCYQVYFLKNHLDSRPSVLPKFLSFSTLFPASFLSPFSMPSFHPFPFSLANPFPTSSGLGDPEQNRRKERGWEVSQMTCRCKALADAKHLKNFPISWKKKTKRGGRQCVCGKG
jgi:hypothetical protein